MFKFKKQLFTLTMVASIFAPVQATEKTLNVDTVSLNCASDYLQLLPQLGRGDDYPRFLINDINAALKQQSATSILTKVQCTSKVNVETTSTTVPESEHEVLSTLQITFPLVIDLTNGPTKYRLTVNQRYIAENLESFHNRIANHVFEVVKQETIK